MALKKSHPAFLVDPVANLDLIYQSQDNGRADLRRPKENIIKEILQSILTQQKITPLSPASG